ncbi:gamma carbonic anhydrase family protein [Geminocystis sp. GBBB08]|uniref:gamma carbonic anhydrase family protein n=1 Tax=Geminocystis sp. GBBB08 TaxID=2604140 RepID=UPI0027E29E79|nr:gamma carbonic anhydrase family protein [Geminocystis sp. GBBB08]MBL1211481.1 gamma carbonic anhydrase family protein [Geminocystis sp. GBBB08]
MKLLTNDDFLENIFIGENASVMGDVTINEGSSIWYGAVVRADVEKIEIGAYTNIQDGAVLHGDPGKITILEDYVTVGHRAVIHSAHIKKGCLIGIGAIVLNGVTIGEGSIIGAGCVVTKDVEPRSLMIGIPARKIRDIDDKEAQDLIQHALKYHQLALYHNGKSNDKGFTTIENKHL